MDTAVSKKKYSPMSFPSEPGHYGRELAVVSEKTSRKMGGWHGSVRPQVGWRGRQYPLSPGGHPDSKFKTAKLSPQGFSGYRPLMVRSGFPHNLSPESKGIHKGFPLSYHKKQY
ncbi:hypothetical protein EAG_15402 [Camponotus floridanus]|uniref:Uncharacterized protein n=1 Tax=Camponotus floridanus TaxID=104421 RepID=E2AI89_CAMFO|nr:hypothetical protein EAG_15402 [Camponotus floridanus]